MILLLIATLLQMTPMPLTTIDRGPTSEVETRRETVARTPAEWAALWRAHAPNRPVPDVDLSKLSVVAVFLGSRPTAGFGVEVLRTRVDGDSLVVEFAERRPAPDAVAAQVLTAPYHIVAIPARAGRVVFEKVGG